MKRVPLSATTLLSHSLGEDGLIGALGNLVGYHATVWPRSGLIFQSNSQRQAQPVLTSISDFLVGHVIYIQILGSHILSLSRGR